MQTSHTASSGNAVASSKIAPSDAIARSSDAVARCSVNVASKDDDIAVLYPYNTAINSIKEKQWALGSKDKTEMIEFLYNIKEANMIIDLRRVSPALLKMFDEIIANALDQIDKGKNLPRSDPKKATRIDVKFDTNDGRITITNNGEGIPIVIHPEFERNERRKLYVPTICFSEAFQGSNRNRKDDSISAGENGIGAKAVNLNSREFMLTTCHSSRKFTQKWENLMEKASEPTIVAYKGSSFTEVSFLPLYERFNHTNADFPALCEYFSGRCAFLASYMRFVYPDASITFNGDSFTNIVDAHTGSNHAKTNTGSNNANTHTGSNNANNNANNGTNSASRGALKPSKLMLALLPKCAVYTFIVKPLPLEKYPYVVHPWQISVAIGDIPHSIHSLKGISNINGLRVREGNHIEQIFAQIHKFVCEYFKKKHKMEGNCITPAKLKDHVFILINGALPRAGWEAQRKEKLTNDKSTFEGYQITPAQFDAFIEPLEQRILAELSSKKKKGTKNKRGEKFVDLDYIPARKAGSKESARCRLVLTEGTAAMSQVTGPINKHLGFEYTGLMAVRGVIINARKEINEIITNKNNIIRNKSAKLNNNRFIKMISKVLNISIDRQYGTQEERDELNYGGIDVCVDQDVDGKGNILGLIINVFELFWRPLLDDGYLRWFCTPIVRAYPNKKGRVVEFYSMQEAELFIKSMQSCSLSTNPSQQNHPNHFDAHPDEIADDDTSEDALIELKNKRATHTIRYFKGLASHSERETDIMFHQYEKHTYKLGSDEQTTRKIEIYYGKETQLRKTELSTTFTVMTLEQVRKMDETMIIPLSLHLDVNTKEYQLDNLKRKLPNEIDGQIQVTRMILCGAIEWFRSHNEPIRTCELGGYISKTQHYTHGDTPMNDAISRQAFTKCGGRQIPFFCPKSFFGSRKKGGKDFGPPRYTSLTLNKQVINVLFPREDMDLCPIDTEGAYQWLCPILPMAILESTKMPAHGWKVDILARCVYDVLNKLRLKITGRVPQIANLSPCIYTFSAHKHTGRFIYLATQIKDVINLPDDNITEITTSDQSDNPDCDADQHDSAETDSIEADSLEANNVDGAGIDGAEIGDKDDIKFDEKASISANFVANNGASCNIGAYKISGNTVIITELPLRVWTNPYIEFLIKRMKDDPDIIENIDQSKCDENIVHIEVSLHPGGLQRIEAKYASSASKLMQLDAIELYFGLHKNTPMEINMINANGGVTSYKSYEEVMETWYPIRKKMYEDRIKRQLEILRLRIILHKETLRYLESGFDARRPIKIVNDDLQKQGYVKFYVTLLDKPDRHPTEKLEQLICKSDRSSYSYLLNIRDIDKTTENKEGFKRKLESVTEKHRELNDFANKGPFFGAQVWLKELGEFEKNFHAGQSTRWQYEELEKYQY